MSRHYEEDDREQEHLDLDAELRETPTRWTQRALAAIANGRHDLSIGPSYDASRSAWLRIYLIDTEAQDDGLIVVASIGVNDALKPSDIGGVAVYKASDILDAEGRYETNAWRAFADVVGQYRLKHLRDEWQRRVRAKRPIAPAVENPF